MNVPASEPTCNVPMETVEDAHQLRAIITGVVGLLQHPHRLEAVSAARAAAMEAQAICDRVVAHLDAVAAMQMERQRVERLHRAESARVSAAAGEVRT